MQAFAGHTGKPRALKPLTAQSKIEKAATLGLATRTFQTLFFGLADVLPAERKRLLDALLHYTLPAMASLLFAVEHGRVLQVLAGVSDAPEAFPGVLRAAFRQRVVREMEAALQHGQERRWRLTGEAVNGDYGCCGSYPSVVPGLPEVNFKEASFFWSNGRFPVWSWSDRRTRTLFLRAAMPLVL